MSLTYVGLWVSLLSVLLPKVGLEIGNDQLTAFVSVTLTIIGAVIGMIGRWRLGGVNAIGLRNQ